METYYNFGQNAKPPMVVPALGAATDEPVALTNGSTIIIDGDLDIGTALAPITDDEPLLYVDQDCTLIVDGDLALYRDVAATNPIIVADSSSKIIVTGDSTVSRAGAGAAGVILCSVDSLVKFIGTFDLVAFGAAAAVAADGTFLTCSRNSIAYFGQLLFNTGGDLDMGAFASILLEMHSQLHVTDVPGASDALNTNNPGAPACTGIMLTSGSEAFIPAYQADTGIGSAAAAANGRDTKVGGAAVADWAGSEVLTDLAAGVPEMCMVYKP